MVLGDSVNANECESNKSENTVSNAEKDNKNIADEKQIPSKLNSSE